jgi:hypothetical protein
MSVDMYFGAANYAIGSIPSPTTGDGKGRGTGSAAVKERFRGITGNRTIILP